MRGGCGSEARSTDGESSDEKRKLDLFEKGKWIMSTGGSAGFVREWNQQVREVMEKGVAPSSTM